MIVRAIARGLVTAAAVLLIGGCAVGRFIAGAPSERERAAARPASANPGGQALLVRRCIGCHEIPDPSRMTALAWHTALDRMKERMRLPESEWDSLAAMAGAESDHDPAPRP